MGWKLRVKPSGETITPEPPESLPEPRCAPDAAIGNPPVPLPQCACGPSLRRGARSATLPGHFRPWPLHRWGRCTPCVCGGGRRSGNHGPYAGSDERTFDERRGKAFLQRQFTFSLPNVQPAAPRDPPSSLHFAHRASPHCACCRGARVSPCAVPRPPEPQTCRDRRCRRSIRPPHADDAAVPAHQGRVPRVLLFYRMGDFYELFYDDARKAARLLDITLTARRRRPASRSRWPACPTTRRRLSRAWCASANPVAICEQIGDPATSKGRSSA